MESIFETIKKMLGIDVGYEVFDQDILVFINSAIGTLVQLGLDITGIMIDKSTAWSVLTYDQDALNLIKNYIYLKVKILFDPPQTSFVLQSYENQIKELEWRINVYFDPKEEDIYVQ